jgi:thiol-disulfide isomerase/thioredoxin
VKLAVVTIALTCALAAAQADELSIGSVAPDGFEVISANGSRTAFASLKGPVTVVAFISAKCPVANAYLERMTDLYQEYSSKGVHFVFLNSNSNESARDLAAPFPVYKDSSNRAADLFGAQTTPEFFVLDSRNALRYHGSFDDSQNAARVRVRGLQSALDALLSGSAVSPERTKAFGCSIHRVRHT